MGSTAIIGPHKNTQELLKQVEGAAFKEQMMTLLRTPEDADRMVRIMASVLTPDVAACSPKSIFEAIMKCCFLQLEPSGDLVYFIPRGGHVHAQLGFQGCQQLLSRLPGYLYQQTECVYENDVFVWEDRMVNGNIEFNFRHVPNPSDRGDGKIKAVYSFVQVERPSGKIVTFKDVMSLDDVENTRRKSSAQSNAWNDFFSEMAKKTVVHRLFKRVPATDAMLVASKSNDDFVTGKTPTLGGVPVNMASLGLDLTTGDDARKHRIAQGQEEHRAKLEEIAKRDRDAADKTPAKASQGLKPVSSAPQAAKTTRKKSSKLVAREQFLAVAWEEAGVGEKKAVETALHFSKRDDARTMTREDWEANTKRVMDWVAEQGKDEAPTTDQTHNAFIKNGPGPFVPPDGKVKERQVDSSDRVSREEPPRNDLFA